jgi:hypothetical protein
MVGAIGGGVACRLGTHCEALYDEFDRAHDEAERAAARRLGKPNTVSLEVRERIARKVFCSAIRLGNAALASSTDQVGALLSSSGFSVSGSANQQSRPSSRPPLIAAAYARGRLRTIAPKAAPNSTASTRWSASLASDGPRSSRPALVVARR